MAVTTSPTAEQSQRVFDLLTAHRRAAQIHNRLRAQDAKSEARTLVWLRAELLFLEAGGFDTSLYDSLLQVGPSDPWRHPPGMIAFKLSRAREELARVLMLDYSETTQT